MRILLDASLPGSLVERSTPLTTFESDPSVTGVNSDEELLEEADNQGFDAVALLGRKALARVNVLETAHRIGSCVVITNSDEPVQAAQHLADRVDELGRQIGPGRVVLVLAREVRTWRIEDFLDERVKSPSKP